MSLRQEQIGSVLKRAISQVLSTRLSDPRITGLISVTRVDVSPDMSNAKVYISVLPEEQAKLSLAGLRSASRHVQRRLKEVVEFRRAPRLEFRLDETLKREADVFADIDAGAARTPAPPLDEPTDDPATQAIGDVADATPTSPPADATDNPGDAVKDAG